MAGAAAASAVSWSLSPTAMAMPTLNTDENANPMVMLEFVQMIGSYKGKLDPPETILHIALKGSRERKWLIELGKWDLVMEKIVTEAKSTRQWLEVSSKVTRGEMLDADLQEHIRLFKIAVEHLGIKDDNVASKLFRASVGTKLLPGHVALNHDYTEKKLDELIKIAQLNEMAS